MERKLERQGTSGAASDVSMLSRAFSLGTSADEHVREPPWYATCFGFDALLRLANTYYASRMVLVTLISFLSLAMLCIFSNDMSNLWLWVVFQISNAILGISALPNVHLYSIVSRDDPENKAEHDDEVDGQRRRKRNRATSFSFLRSSFHTIETKLEPFLLKRSKILRLCETIAIIQIVILYMVIVTWILLIWVSHEPLWKMLTFSTEGTLGVLAIVCVILQTIEFDRLRAHEQLQLGVGLDQDQLEHATTHKKRPPSSSRISTVLYPTESQETTESAELSGPPSSGSERIDVHLGSSPETVEEELRRGLYEAAVNGDHDKAQELLDVMERALGSKANVEMLLLKIYATPTLWLWSFAFTTYNPLHIACRLGDETMVEILLNGGMNPNLLDKTQGAPFSLRLLYEMCQGRYKNLTSVLGSPLHVAVAHGHTHVIDVLVRHPKTNIDIIAETSVYSKSMRVPPIFLAESAEVIEALIRHRANFLIVPGKGNSMNVTVLQRAMLNDRSELENVLLEWGADVALTPLHEAAAAGDIVTVKHYLSLGIPPDQLGEFQDGVNRRTALHWASVMGRHRVVQELIMCHANVNAPDACNYTPLHWAARHGHVETVEMLLLAGANPLLCDDDGLTPMAFSAAGGLLNTACVALFLEYGVDINGRLPNEFGDTCLHLALREGHQDAALALIQHGADLASYNGHGEPAIKCCASAEQQYGIKMISKWTDIVISYDSAYYELAKHLKQGIEESYLTVFMRDINADAQESMFVMRDASAVVCILTPGFERNPICMEELSHAKENHVPVMAITIESMNLPEELQVYLFTRQLVPFRDAIIGSRRRSSVRPSTETPGNEESREFRFKLDDIKFKRSLQNLIDGLRDEVELHELSQGHERTESEPDETKSMHLSEVGRDSSATRLTSPRSSRGTTRGLKHRNLNDVVRDVLGRRRRASMMQGLSVTALVRRPVFLSHGDCHTEFVTNLHKELQRHDIPVTLDSMAKVSSMKERILAAKDAILQCDVFLVVLSEKSVKTELVSDQLAFAEDKGKVIVPVYYTRRPGLVDAVVKQLLDANDRPMRIFGNDVSYGRGFDELLADLKQEQERAQAQEEDKEWVPISPAAKNAAEHFLQRSRLKPQNNRTILV